MKKKNECFYITKKKNLSLEIMKNKSINKKVTKISSFSTPKASHLGDINSIDSLKVLKGKNEFTDIDNKIQFLKSQLKSLIEEPGDTGNDKFLKKNEKLLASECDDGFPRFSDVNTKQKFNCNFFDEHSDNSVLNDITILEDKNNMQFLTPIFDKQPLLIQSKFLGDDSNLLSKISESTADIGDMDFKKVSLLEKAKTKIQDNHSYNLMESKKNKYRISQSELERLLYKSFLMQTLGKEFSSSKKVELEETKPNAKLKTSNLKTNKFRYKRSKKIKKNLKTKFPNRNSRKYNRISSNSEVVNGGQNLRDKNQGPTLIDLDVDIQSFNWDEPFVTDEEKNFSSSDLEIVEDLGTQKQKGINKNKFSSKNYSAVENHKNSNEKQTNELHDLEFKNHYTTQVNKNLSAESCKDVRKTTWECPICFEPSVGQEIVTTFCGHIFCKKCINNYHSTSKKCPLCSSDLSNKPIITLFNF